MFPGQATTQDEEDVVLVDLSTEESAAVNDGVSQAEAADAETNSQPKEPKGLTDASLFGLPEPITNSGTLTLNGASVPAAGTLKMIATASDLAKYFAEEDARQLVIDLGGLAGAGKTTLLNRLMPILKAAGLKFMYLDKDVIGQEMAAAAPDKKFSSADIYAEMVRRTTEALADPTNQIIIREGNIIANLNCFVDSINAEHKKGIIHTLLYVKCSNGIQNWNRIQARAQLDPEAKKRDADKLDMFAYLLDDDLKKGPRVKETERHEAALQKYASLFDSGVVQKLELDTVVKSGLDIDRDAKISELVQQVLEFMCDQVKLSTQPDVYAEELQSYKPGLFA